MINVDKIMGAIKFCVVVVGTMLVTKLYIDVVINDRFTNIPEVPTISTPSPTATLIPTVTPTPIIILPSLRLKAAAEYSNRGQTRAKALNMRATAYDLSIESCGKSRSHPQYGITATGVKATVRHTVAVDPEFIKLGSRVYIEFPESDSFRNGVYHTEDTGNKVLGNIIDIYLGEDEVGENFVKKAVDRFGCKPVKVYILKGGS